MWVGGRSLSALHAKCSTSAGNSFWMQFAAKRKLCTPVELRSTTLDPKRPYVKAVVQEARESVQTAEKVHLFI